MTEAAVSRARREEALRQDTAAGVRAALAARWPDSMTTSASAREEASSPRTTFSICSSKIGKSLMLPVAVLPVAGLLLGIGAANFDGMPPIVSELMKSSGDVDLRATCR